MDYVTLNNGIKMPTLGFGTFLLNGSECVKTVTKAIRYGYRLIDTAEAYQNESEVGYGISVAVEKFGLKRKDLFLVTKVNFRSYEYADKTVEASLTKLQTGYLDLVLLHWPYGNYYKAWRCLEKLHKEGKIRAIGVSNFNPDRLIDLIEFNDVKPCINQIETHLLCQRIEEHKWMEKYDVQHMAYSPLGQGKNMEIFNNPLVLAIAKKYHKSPAQVALRFLLQKDMVVIPKTRHINHMKENFTLFDFELTKNEIEQLTILDQAKTYIGNPENPEKTQMAMTW